jgi:preprotein translocase subunit SecG
MGSNDNFAYFVIGGLIIAVGLLAFLFLQDGGGAGVEIEVNKPQISGNSAN